MWLLLLAGAGLAAFALRSTSAPTTAPKKGMLGPIRPLTTATAPSGGLDPCRFLPASAQDHCRRILSGNPEKVAQYYAAVGGTAACVSAGAGALAPLCGEAASKIASWLFGGYTPAERARLLYLMARANGAAGGQLINSLIGFFPMAQWPNPQLVEKRDIVRYNIRLVLGLTKDVWESDDEEGARNLILMAMIGKGVAGKGIIWWGVKRA